MIVERNRSGAIGIKQEDHAKLAGFFLQNWSDHAFPRDPDREKILLATCEHDNGWQEFDAAPRLDAKTHLPVDFLHMTGEETYEIWKRGSERYLESDPFVALLITHHAYTLNEHNHRKPGIWKQFFVEFARQRARLRDQLGLAHNDVERAYSYLRMMDYFSLFFCTHGLNEPDAVEKYGGYTFRRDGSELLFRPYPFARKGLTHQLPYYAFPKGGFANEEDAQAALKTPSFQEVIINPLERWE